MKRKKKSAMEKKIEVTGELRVRSYDVLYRAVEEGLGYGWHRAHKHTDKPDEDAIRQQILDGVMSAVCEYFTFGDDAAL